MENAGGMVAIVQGLRDSGLTVTLLDGARQYTLSPEAAPQSPPPQLRSNPSVNSTSRHQQCDDERPEARRQRDNGVQATDGRYASTYKMMHCNVNPTSPSQNVTEFPPQRPDVLPGQGNFVVGGAGSGETCSMATKSNSFRGANCWPDRGSVCVSKPSIQPDSFASSLRKYPSISPDRSTEIVERLISFTQAKNMSRNYHRSNLSPPREPMSTEASKQTYIVNSNNSNMTKAYPEIGRRVRTNDNSPVRERCRNEFEDSVYRRYSKNNEVRCFRHATGRDSDGLRNMSSDKLPKCSPPRHREYDCAFDQRNTLEHTSNNSVNMEIQASAQMESKEILTLPRIVPMQRTIGTSLSPVPSSLEARINSEDNSYYYAKLRQKCSCKSIQVTMPYKDVKSTSSSVDIDRNKVICSKRSRSDEQLGSTRKNLKNAIFKLLQDLNSDSKGAMDIQDEPRSKIVKQSRDPKPLLTKYECLRRTVSDNMCSDENILGREASKHTYAILKDCLQINTYDLSDNVKNEDQMSQDYVDKLNYRSSNISMFSAVGNVDDVPKRFNKTFSRESPQDIVSSNFVVRNKLPLNRNDFCHKHNYKYKDFTSNNARNSNEPLTISIQELRNLIDLDILAFTEKHSLNITSESLYDLREELIDIILMDGKYMASINQKSIRKNVKKVLENGGFTDFYSVSLTKILTEHWAERFSINKLNLQPPSIKSDTYIVLPNININSSKYVQSDSNQKPDYSINEISQKDIDANVNIYTSKISDEVNDWLASIDLPEAQNETLRQSIVDYLANEIVDRQKYLELNPTNEVSDASELEYLKYQIFKCMHKLIGANNMSPVENALELRKKVQSVPVPVFTIKQRRLSADKGSNHEIEPFPQMNIVEPSNVEASSTRRLSSPVRKCCKRETCKRNINAARRNYSLREPEYGKQVPTSTRRMSSPEKLYSNDDNEQRPSSIYELHRTPVMNTECQQKSLGTDDSRTSSGHFSGGIKIRDDDNETGNLPSQRIDINKNKDGLTGNNNINENYAQYLKDWVEKVPIPANSADEKAFAEKARNEIFIAMLNIVSKLKSGPEILKNRFLLEDKLDDEIETLLCNLPQSPELDASKHILKVKLIEKTIDCNDLLKSTPTKSYKQKLVESLRGEMPEYEDNEDQDPEVLHLYEDLQVLNLVEDFIIQARFHNEDKVTSEVYRKKLLKHCEEFVAGLKTNHRKALKNIDSNLYVSKVLNTLKKVPLPSNDTIQEEADEILLGIEIEKWLSQLPLIAQNDFIGPLLKRRLRNHLTKQILDIERGVDNTDGALDDTLKHEVSQFLGKAPLQEGESLNINSMVEDLINRIKNRRKSTESDGKKVGFHETNYDEFSRNMPHCSSYTEYPKYNRNENNKFMGQPTAGQTFSGNYNVKPLFDDVTVDPKCYKPNTPIEEQAETDEGMARPFRESMEPNWYTLEESTQEPPNRGRPSRLVRHSIDRTYYPDTQDEQDDRPEQTDGFVTPRKFKPATSYEYVSDERSSNQQDHSSRRVNTNRSPRATQNDGRRDLIIDRRVPSTQVPTSPRRREGIDQNGRRDQHETSSPHRSYSPNQTEYRPDLFHKSTDREGRRKTIERNRSMEATMDRSSSFYLPRYTPSMIPPGYVPVRMDRRPHMRRHEEDSEEEDEEIRCRCLAKYLRSNRRPKYCPLEGHDYPMCLSPYFYPYYY